MRARTNQEVGFCGMRMIPPAGSHEPMGAQLKTAFDRISSPMPDRMQELADALEQAFERGELFAKKRLS